MATAPDGYQALRSAAAWFPLPRDVLAVSGPDAAGFLQGQLSQDLAALGDGASAEALLLQPDGKLVALLRITRVNPERFVLDVEAGFSEVVAARLARFKLRTKVDVEPMAWRCAAVRGPATQAPSPNEAAPIVARVDFNGLSGVDLLGPEPERALPDGLVEASAQAWVARRIEAGVPMMGGELDERTIAAEAHLVERAVSLTKGCYTGQELVARLDARGSKVARRLMGLRLDADVDGGGVVPGTYAGAELIGGSGAKVLGRLTSAAYSPFLDQLIGLGAVHRSVAEGELVDVLPPEGAGAKRCRAVVAPLPMA